MNWLFACLGLCVAAMMLAQYLAMRRGFGITIAPSFELVERGEIRRVSLGGQTEP